MVQNSVAEINLLIKSKTRFDIHGNTHLEVEKFAAQIL